MPPSPTPRTVLGASLRDRGWTADQLCRVYAETAAQMPIRAKTVAYRTAQHWVAGDSYPQPAARAVLEKIFGVPVDQLLAPPAPTSSAEPNYPAVTPAEIIRDARTGAYSGWFGYLGSDIQAATWRQPSPHPSHGPTTTYSEITSPVTQAGDDLTMAAEDAARFLARAYDTATSAEAVGLLRAQIGRVSHALPIEDVRVALADLSAAQRFAFRHLDGPAHPGQARDLYFLAAVTAGLLAHASLGLGSPSAAMTHTQTALLCADRAGDPALRLWVRNEQSTTARWANWQRDALRFTEMGETDAPAVQGRTALGHGYRHARALAALGRVEQAHAALDRAAATHDRVASAEPDELDQFGGYLFFSDGDARYVAADAHSFLPDPVAAERAATTAVATLTSTSEESSSNLAATLHGAYLLLALARARNNDPDGAREALRPTMSLPIQNRSSAVFVGVRRVHDALTDPRYQGTPAARDLADELEAYEQDAPQPLDLPQ